MSCFSPKACVISFLSLVAATKQTSCPTYLLGYWKSEIEAKTLTHESRKKLRPADKAKPQTEWPTLLKAIECFLFDFLCAVSGHDSERRKYMAVCNDRTAAVNILIMVVMMIHGESTSLSLVSILFH